MAVRYAALSACRKVHVCHCNSLGGATWRSVAITGRTDRQTDRRTDRVRRNMRPPPREEGRIIMPLPCASSATVHCQQTPSHQCSRELLSLAACVKCNVIPSIQGQSQGPPSRRRPRPTPRRCIAIAKDRRQGQGQGVALQGQAKDLMHQGQSQRQGFWP